MIDAETQYVRSGDTHIAYQVVGNGPIDIVYVPGWVSHVELCWEDPIYARFLNQLASYARLIMFDKRGTGLSDRVRDDQLPTLEERMDDLNVVMDAVGSTNAALFGFSEGGNLCALFAATYPERTRALIMFGTFAKRIWSEDYPWAPTPDERQKNYDLVEREWGRMMDLDRYVPSMARDDAYLRRLASYFRRAASPGAAVSLLKMNTQIDVSNILPVIHVPTLVLHRRDDLDAHVDEGRWLAERIPNASFKELPGADHLPWVGDQADILDEIEEFLTGNRPAAEIGTALATILVTDIVGSTELVRKIGDQAWRDLLDQHETICMENIQHYRGQLVNHTGDGVVAAFDGPVRGITCAQNISKQVQKLGFEIRAGLHTGECEIRGQETAGLAIHLAARVSALAGPNEILVSSAVANLVSNPSLNFADRGHHTLKGFPDKWQVFAVESPQGEK
jgi:pimeloyl-ACP methyl ester carboxylesterase